MYKEQIYKLYHKHLTMYPENYAENILWLTNTLKADFTNPLNALASIKTKQEWEWYRNLFLMHVNLLLTKQYLQWGAGYMKFNAFFYNSPYRDMSIRSMKKATMLIEYSENYWDEAKKYSQNIRDMNVYFMYLPKIQYWKDEYTRIRNKTLDYSKIIKRELSRIERVVQEFKLMDDTTY